MRIGVDGYNLAMPRGTGVSTYGYVLANTLKLAGYKVDGLFGLDVGKAVETREVMFFDQLASEPPHNRPRGELRRERRQTFVEALKRFGARRLHAVPLTDNVEKSAFASRFPRFDRLYSSWRLFEIAHRHFRLYGSFLEVAVTDPPDVMHWTYPIPLRLRDARNVYTLHDLVPLRLPYTTLDVKQAYFRIVSRCVALADRICTVSEASRSDIVAQFGIDPNRIVNTYQASPLPADALALSPGDDAEMIRGIFGLERDGYFLFFGAIEPKKNLGRLLEAYLSIRTKTPLVIVGGRAWQSDAELRLMPKNGEASPDGTGRVIQLDYLPRALLLRLIRSARAVTFPSLYEGFGLPLLEAMQLGTPILTSELSSLPEVAGDAAIYVDPYSVVSLAEGLRRLDRDAELRGRLGTQGLQQAEKFSQTRYIKRLEQLYAEALHS